MFKKEAFVYVFILSLLFIVPALSQETLTLTTYYPSPQGVFNRLVLQTLGVGDTNNDTLINSVDAPDPSIASQQGDVWIRGDVGIGLIAMQPNAPLQVNGAISRQNTTLSDTATQVNLGANSITGGTHSAIGGGQNNSATGNFSTIGGGSSNLASGLRSTVAGGYGNNIISNDAVIGGGSTNAVTGNYSAVAGGEFNIGGGLHSIIGGGYSSWTTANNSTIGGGYMNVTTANYSTVAGGQQNDVTGLYGTIGGGRSNLVSGQYATVPGGTQNLATGNYSFAAGYQSAAVHNGSFVWSDSTGAFASSGNNQFLISASGGVGIGTTNPGAFMLNVDGGDVRCGGDLLVNTDLSVGGDGHITNNLQVDSNGTINGTLIVNGTGSITGTTSVGADLTVQGQLHVLTGGPDPITGFLGDIAEYILVEEEDALELGDIVVIDRDNPRSFTKSSQAYDPLVAGIISSKEQAAMVIGTETEEKKLLALAGQVACKVTTENGAIGVGDFLTTSSKPGYAMKASDPKLGTVLGKALEALEEGEGKILVLVTLQ